MPSIEIVCIAQVEPLDCAHYPFAVESSSVLKSHRGPTPRFQSHFDRLVGVIYHLGNPQLKGRAEGGFFAYELLSDRSRSAELISALEFRAEVAGPVFALLDRLIAASPESRILFTSDWQFGPDHARHVGPVSVGRLRELHDTNALILNTAYEVHAC